MNFRDIGIFPYFKPMIVVLAFMTMFNNCTIQNPNPTVLDYLYVNQPYNVSMDPLNRLNKTYRVFSKINSSAFISDTNLLIKASSSNILDIFATNGDRINGIKLSNCFVTPTQNWPIKVYNDSIYIWCENRSILQVFNKNLSKVHEIYCPKTTTIRDFIVNEHLVIFYNKANPEYLISVFDRYSGIYLFETGKPTIEHRIMEQSINAGGMTLRNNSLFYCRADCLNLYSINLKSFEEDMVEIKVPEFVVAEYPINNLDSPIDYNLAYKFKANSSSVAGLFLVKDTFMIVSEVGTYSYKNPSGEILYDNRYFLFLLYDFEKGIKKSLFKINDPMLSSDYVEFLTNGADLFSISPSFSDNNDWVFLFSKISMMLVGASIPE